MTGDQRIVLVNSSLGCGGAERVMSILANRWAAVGTDVSVVTVYSHQGDYFELDHRVRRRDLQSYKLSRSALDGMFNNLSRVLKLRRTLKDLKPSVVVSFQSENNILSLLAAVSLACPVIISERNDPRMRLLPPVWNKLRQILYRRAAALVIQTESLREWGGSLIDPSRVRVFPNPVLAPDTAREVEQPRQHTIVAAGSLVAQKGFDLLLEAVASCSGKWSLIILGEGPDRESLEESAKQLGIDDRVSLPGQIKNPASVFRAASLFVLSSRYEGFPNVLVEAMACGLPAVSFDCQSGPSEIIRQGVDGLLVPDGDVSALSSAIDELMHDSVKRKDLSTRAPDVIERFSLERVMSSWDLLVAQAGAGQVLDGNA